jgi:hypothetical protein
LEIYEETLEERCSLSGPPRAYLRVKIQEEELVSRESQKEKSQRGVQFNVHGNRTVL